MATPRKKKAKRAKKVKKKPSAKLRKAKPRKKKPAKKPAKRKVSGRTKPKAKSGKRPAKRKPSVAKRKPRGTSKRATPRRSTPRVPTAPEGFESISGLDLESAILAIRTRLELAAELGRVRVWPYADGSVDGEILAQLPRGQSASDVLQSIEDAIGREGLEGFWISVGVRYTIKEDEEVYRRFKGFNDVNTHYQRAIASNVAEVFVIGRHEIAEGMANKYGRKADSVYVRFHWNPDNAKPVQRESH